MKKKTLPIKTIYYTDEKNDEFSSIEIIPKRIDEHWRYLRYDFWWKVKRWLSYRLCAHPIGYGYCKIKFAWKVENRQKLKAFGKERGYFIYGNHTQERADAFIPSLAVCPKAAYTIVHPSNVSIPVLGKINPYMGALPLPDTLQASRNFKAAVQARYQEGNAIMIYPEAHIWPYYTGIRSFPSTSFRYPAELGAPCFALTNVYKKHKRGIKPRIVTYIDGPFYPDESLSIKARAQKLRDEIYKIMVERSKESDCVYICYLPKEGK